MTKEHRIKCIIGIIFLIMIYINSYSCDITEDSVGILLRNKRFVKVVYPGRTIYPPMHEIKSIVSKLNTDAKFNIYCKSYDDYYVTTDAFVDNKFNCTDDECYKMIYSQYYITESIKYQPEDGMFFKYFPEILPQYCQKLTLYQMQTAQWSTLFPDIKKSLQEKVGNNITIVDVRLTRPNTKKEDIEWVQSNIGLITNRIYRTTKYLWSRNETY